MFVGLLRLAARRFEERLFVLSSIILIVLLFLTFLVFFLAELFRRNVRNGCFLRWAGGFPHVPRLVGRVQISIFLKKCEKSDVFLLDVVTHFYTSCENWTIRASHYWTLTYTSLYYHDRQL